MTSLSERLRRLQGGTAPGPSAEALPVTKAALAQRLERMDPTRRRVAVGPAPDAAMLAELLGGEVPAPGVLRLVRARSLAHRHGRFQPGDAVHALGALHVAGRADLANTLFLDTETSGLAGGTGTWAFVCGFGRILADRLILTQYLLTRLDAEPVFLTLLARELEGVRQLVSYNGKSFDLPLLVTRFRLSGMAPDFEGIDHLDLLHPVRRAFARRWPDCRLTNVERRLLGFTRRDDLPGAEAPEAWRAWLRHGDHARLGAVLRHNRTDLISLVALIPALAAMQRDPADHDADVGAIARHWSRAGDTNQALALLERSRSALDTPALHDLAALYRRRGAWERATGIWRALAHTGDVAALLALAKYHEHQVNDPAGALELARRLPAGPERERRCHRLEAKQREEWLQVPRWC